MMKDGVSGGKTWRILQKMSTEKKNLKNWTLATLNFKEFSNVK